MSKLATHSKTKEIIQKYDFRLTRSLGQNFLVDADILNKIVDAAEITREDIVFEVGTGIGTLTYELALRAKKVIAIEIDKNLIPILEETLRDVDNVEIVNQDILKTDLNELSLTYAEGKPIKVVANLPYYITTAIIMKFLESGIPLDLFVLMIQKEVAERISAKPSTKDYGSLTVALQYYAESELLCKVPRLAFIPPPNVDSSVIRLRARQKKEVQVENEELFFKVIRGSFSKRRKTIINSLSTYESFNKEQIASGLKKAGIDPKRRGETLTIDEFAKLTNCIDGERDPQLGEKIDKI
ncbi:MAG: 16S rRNA (adenine(1518)-N(6)/adenine(1519)-N(6))-dimethyltransferase RsmA [Peptostreptococcaceae bacterium]|nr:16S rRNA (adenine(1518)-N(6)/adenine(1519)-N(6))-dimethyltransferase RsmA [Peptostreptococcaceae bacterium]